MQIEGIECRGRGKVEFLRVHHGVVEKGYTRRIVPLDKQDFYFLEVEFVRIAQNGFCHVTSRIEKVSTLPPAVDSLSRYLSKLWEMSALFG